ncbi:hypothetical protein SADUNF_Sadunf19G0014700 [Salix dunnii]|uniref:Uncharacterized protein n=1 Tax=Salix dunnii TaxID=1413687 RepID=A0A835IZX8_9ROSI|nr:hypothetical protein SADUNF_Sadunf19G0014700 [Salix dunnii]
MAIALSDILRITSTLLMLMFLTFCMGATNLEAQVGGLANDEVEALLEVATQLGKKGWNRNMTLCNDTVLPPKPADNKNEKGKEPKESDEVPAEQETSETKKPTEPEVHKEEPSAVKEEPVKGKGCDVVIAIVISAAMLL